MKNFCIIDKQDYEYIKKWYWRKDKRKDKEGYWISNNKKENIDKGESSTVKLHQVIATLKYGEYDKNKFMPDHLNRNHDDNRRCNLVLKTSIDNSHNRGLSKKNTSGKTGVHKTGNKWTALITVNYKDIYLGRYDNYNDAVNARKKAELEYGFTCDDIFPIMENN